MSSGYVSRMWFAWVPPKMRDIAIFSECRKRDVPVGNLSSRNNSVATPFSGCCHVPFVPVRVYLFVFFRLLFRSLSLSLSFTLSLHPFGIRPCPYYNGISCLHVILTISRLVLHVFLHSTPVSYFISLRIHSKLLYRTKPKIDVAMSK